MTEYFGYGDIRFYLAALLIAEIACMVACFFDVRMRGLLRRHPFMFHACVFMLTAVSLYASDSNKPVPPEKPIKKIRVYIHRGNGGGRWVPIGVNTVERSTIKQSEENNIDE